jgi:hypothetical protein
MRVQDFSMSFGVAEKVFILVVPGFKDRRF